MCTRSGGKMSEKTGRPGGFPLQVASQFMGTSLACQLRLSRKHRFERGARVATLRLSSRMGVSSSPSSRGPCHPTRDHMRFRKSRHHGIKMDIHDEDPTLASTPPVSCMLIATDSPWNPSTPLRQAAPSTTSAAARSSDTVSATSSLRDISAGLPRLIPTAG